MTEETYEKKVLSLLTKIADQTQPKQSKEESSEAPKEDAHKHWKATEVLNSDCPECELQADEIIRETMRKRRTDKEKYPVKCAECGTPVRKDEKDCPTCGGTDATERS